MQKVFTLLIVFALTTVISAQESSEKKVIKKTIETFFEGLHKGDSTLVSSTLNSTINIQTTFTNKEGKKVLVTESKSKLLANIANKKPEHTYLERLVSWDIKVDGNLASVWTLYEFYLNDKFSHCGANSFQLFNNNGKWEIIYLVDMRRRNNCKALKQ
ncbi:nuclear transport factor 2 family protein [Tenacibaculum sp. Mcav3-52]|uniref:Nuclear transport factor 2 family protein n=1 Tax=Tenacibaculum mesophilum TaxID=104268 RepID=A0AAE9MN35_9FLAO|nr:nuclear transport factor 2 family protein [Tenacibaculum mesophilum]KAF9659488.1 nuclear transport factor 2 family protein [Tenacibaculum mesophilum]MCG7500489.1 nuclear transport factor 2 family protein [Tenacibaculum sp. Mcav3-52]MCO7184458.1 nuclear transport factor 2 family protein [Tenacibaculum sp. XPcli2-G]UTD15956.1 nuclear transport factor 2 family protein [Tenacibaculum mesophilum]